jgi:hypothetical protein
LEKVIDALMNFNPLIIIPIAIVGFIFVYNLITIITSSFIESRLLTKEWRAVRYVYRTIMLFGSIVFLLSYLSFTVYYFFHKYYLWLIKSEEYNSISVVLTIVSTMGFIYFKFFYKNPFTDCLDKTIKYLYLGFVTSYIVVYIGVNNVYTFLISMEEISRLNIGLFNLFFIFSICSILFYFLIEPIIPKKNDGNKEVFIIMGDDKWYLLHPLNRKEFIIGDYPSQDECKKIKIIGWDALKAYEIQKATL